MMSATTGKALDAAAHIQQSIADILRTPIGTRVMRRDYGSRLFDLMDAPMGPGINVEITAAVAEAIGSWEPRVKVERVVVEAASPGHLVLSLRCTLADGTPMTFEGITI